MKNFITNSEIETKKLASELAKKINSGVIGLTGQLGAGKTVFVQGFAQGLGITEKITSPTFILIRQHIIPKSKRILYHIDLYRLENLKNIKDLGIEEIISEPNSICLIEWAEKIAELPKNTIKIDIKKLNEFRREITIS